jgi:hypothetical protein
MEKEREGKGKSVDGIFPGKKTLGAKQWDLFC